jgi:hypothetical protein
MARTLSENQVTHDLGVSLQERLVRSVIRGLQSLRDKSQLSGEFSGLRSVWEEICVQQRDEESFFWAAYLQVIDAMILGRLEALQPYELDALWLLTYEAEDWGDEDEEHRASYPVAIYDVQIDLQGHVLSKACDWSNSRIERYLERDYD